jgi:hypothetical protein
MLCLGAAAAESVNMSDAAKRGKGGHFCTYGTVDEVRTFPQRARGDGDKRDNLRHRLRHCRLTSAILWELY